MRGPHLRLFEAIGRVHPQVLGRTLPLNGAGVCGAVLADLGLPLAMLRGFALLARTGGLLGQIAEEQRDADRERHLHARGPQRQVRSTEVRVTPYHLIHGKGAAMATIAAVIASTHHPFYYRASTSTGADRPPFADEWVAKITSFRETLTRANPDVLVLVGSDHFHQLWLDNMPQFLVGKAPFYDANWYNEEREFGLPRMFFKGEEDLSSHILRSGLDAGLRPRVQQRAADRPQRHLPDDHAAAGVRPADRADLHEHLRAAAAAAEAVRAARPDDPRGRRVLAGQPAGRDHRHRAPLA